MNTWRESFRGAIYPFDNYGFPETRFLLDLKDFSVARRNFLFFGGREHVKKGLDLLLEIFPRHPDLNLYVGASLDYDYMFCKCYHKELYYTHNVHQVGWVRVNSMDFYKLASMCAYVIHPSCTEGQPGSVVQCMYTGMIPVVTKEAGIDTEDFGITLADDSLEEIERTILELAELPEQWHRDHSIRTRQIAEERFSEKAFINRWREILGDILKERLH